MGPGGEGEFLPAVHRLRRGAEVQGGGGGKNGAKGQGGGANDQEHPSSAAVAPEALHQQQQELEQQQQQKPEPDPQPSASDTANSAADGNANAVATQPQQPQKPHMALALHESHKPLWLSSREGWSGGLHSDAVTFCASVRGKRLCPYSAMCPHGPEGAIMGGRHRLEFDMEGEQYAPVMGGSNHWVNANSIFAR